MLRVQCSFQRSSKVENRCGSSGGAVIVEQKSNVNIYIFDLEFLLFKLHSNAQEQLIFFSDYTTIKLGVYR